MIKVDKIWLVVTEEGASGGINPKEYPGEFAHCSRVTLSAEAQVSYAWGASRRVDVLSSGGIGGINAADEPQDYLDDLAEGQWEDLRDHLRVFGVAPGESEWTKLLEQWKGEQ